MSQRQGVRTVWIRAYEEMPVVSDEVAAELCPKRGALCTKRLCKLVKQGPKRAERDEGGEGGGAGIDCKGGALARAGAVRGERLQTDGNGAGEGDATEGVAGTIADMAGGARVLNAVGGGCGETKGWGGLMEGATAVVLGGLGAAAGCWGEGEGGWREEEEGEKEKETEEEGDGGGCWRMHLRGGGDGGVGDFVCVF